MTTPCISLGTWRSPLSVVLPVRRGISIWQALRTELSGGMVLLLGLRPPFRLPLWSSFRQGAAHSFGIEVFRVHRSAGLLTPGVIQGPRIDGIEAEFVDQLHDDCFCFGIVTGN